jgi:alkanesulfonate monooxygenase SsuD/methylene tetrahydromethanopterin reductase-like flavin-dependent oxidoreductase (luciferase family)
LSRGLDEAAAPPATGSKLLKFVISAAFQPPGDLVPIAIAAEEAGFEAVSFSDHVVYPEELDTPYPYTDDGTRRYDENSHFPDPWVVAGAFSSVKIFDAVAPAPMK